MKAFLNIQRLKKFTSHVNFSWEAVKRLIEEKKERKKKKEKKKSQDKGNQEKKGLSPRIRESNTRERRREFLEHEINSLIYNCIAGQGQITTDWGKKNREHKKRCSSRKN